MAATGAKTKHCLLGLLLALGVGMCLLLLLVPEPQDVQAQVAPASPTIDKECTPNPVQVGQQLTCTIDVVAAPDTAAIVRVTDTLPAGLRVTGATAVIAERLPPETFLCTVVGNTVTCPPEPAFSEIIFTSLTFRVTIEAIAVQCGTFTNTATAEGEVASILAGGGTGPEVPFTVQDTEDITVEGCEEVGGGSGGGAGGAVPITQGFEQETGETGEVDLSVDVT